MAGGLRERKKSETRLRLMYSALELFAERDYEHVSVSDIAAAADVSTRTFFRYFETKADAVFGLQAASIERIRGSDDVLVTAEEELREYAARVAADPALYATQTRLVLQYHQVRVRRLEVTIALSDEICAGFRRELPSATPLCCRYAAHLTVDILPASMDTWIEAGAPGNGPDWEAGIAMMRAQVNAVLGR